MNLCKEQVVVSKGRIASFLCVVEMKTSPPKTEASNAASPGRRKVSGRILVVDDDRDVREEIIEFLAHEGYEIRGVARGEDALVEVYHFRPHLVLLDLQLPGRGGFQIASEMRRLPGFRTVPILGVSGVYVDEKFMLGMKLCGIRNFIPKPIDREQLISKVAGEIKPGE